MKPIFSREQVQVILARVNSQAKTTVMDAGIGIHPDSPAHVFERVRQEAGSMNRTHGGLGPGLSIVKHLVELHGEIFGVESPGIGRGATLLVQLPLMSAHRITDRDGKQNR